MGVDFLKIIDLPLGWLQGGATILQARGESQGWLTLRASSHELSNLHTGVPRSIKTPTSLGSP